MSAHFKISTVQNDLLSDLVSARDPVRSCRLRAAPSFSQSVECEAKKNDLAKIGDEASGSGARKNEGLTVPAEPQLMFQAEYVQSVRQR